jgi:hypothetical protein
MVVPSCIPENIYGSAFLQIYLAAAKECKPVLALSKKFTVGCCFNRRQKCFKTMDSNTPSFNGHVHTFNVERMPFDPWHALY